MARPGKTILYERGCSCAALSAATRFMVGPGSSAPFVAGSNVTGGSFYLEPDDYIGTKLRVRVTSLTNAVAPVSDFTVGIYPITAVAGGAATVNITNGNVIAASQVIVSQPGVSSMIQSVSPEFDWPVAGYYIMGVVTSAAGTASSCVQLQISLEAR